MTAETKKESSSNQRTLLIVIVVMAVLITLFVMLFSSSSNDTSAAKVAPPPTIKSTAAGGNETEAYKSLVDEHNKNQYEKAKDTGESNIVTLSNAKEREKTKTLTEVAKTEPIKETIPTTNNARKVNPAYKAEIAAIMDSWKLSAHKITKTSYEPEEAAESNASVEQDSLVSNSLESKIIQAGDRFYASLELNVNSDYPGVVTATILSGRFKNATAIGQFNRVESRLVLNFPQIALPTGQTLSGIESIAIDIEEKLPSLKGKVNNHIFTNHILPGAANFALGVANATLNSGVSTINSFGTTSTVNETLSTKDKITIGIGEVAKGVSDDLFSDKREPTVTRSANSKFVLMILNDVFSSNIDSAGEVQISEDIEAIENGE